MWPYTKPQVAFLCYQTGQQTEDIGMWKHIYVTNQIDSDVCSAQQQQQQNTTHERSYESTGLEAIHNWASVSEPPLVCSCCDNLACVRACVLAWYVHSFPVHFSQLNASTILATCFTLSIVLRPALRPEHKTLDTRTYRSRSPSQCPAFP